jgi:SRSO17 transposase
MQWNEKLWRRNAREFSRFVAPVVADLGRSERRVAATRYLQGLLMSGARKSIGPMAERLGVDSQALQQFIKDSPWDEHGVWLKIRRDVLPHLEPVEAWVVDETGWLKQGNHSVGVAHQYCGAVGKQAHCQVSVELVVTDGEIAAPVAGRLYLPESWASDRERCAKAGVPETVGFKTKSELALDLIDEAITDEVARAPVLADSAYGDSGAFRRALRVRRLEYFLQVDAAQLLAWTVPVQTERKRTRWHVRDGQPKPKALRSLAGAIPLRQWKRARWKAADGTDRETRLAWQLVYLASDVDEKTGDGPPSWMVVDWPEGEDHPYHIYTAVLHRQPSVARCLKYSRGRWPIEQYFQRSKDELGFDHFEGRSWMGFHHHLVLTAVAYLFILCSYLRNKKNFWCYVGTGASSNPAVAREVDRLLSSLPDEI